MIVVVILLVLAVVAGLTAAFAVALARSGKKSQAAATHIPGVDVVVPASWAGSHDPEARLHRRIRDAAKALDATIGNADVAQLDERARLLLTARELDQRLVTIWALPANAKADPLAAVERGISEFEEAAAATTLAPGLDSGLSAPPTLPPIPPLPPQPAERRDRPEPPAGLAQ
ncbi:hypothetical protein JVX90_16165 [Gordonia sp. PDNC005]|uniref:hypothetical protein n=1 Tax=unclassified Gordonia (in: high G+C Gram-positive bacteria) TaxID=2657482 RepID=UPI0019663548|nr:hypothetical protein [Gordonia sp. PDNC005]QRY61921.1 hypothetical protein JVX90_16165 [Gordonia sp. PDNC005]